MVFNIHIRTRTYIYFRLENKKKKKTSVRYCLVSSGVRARARRPKTAGSALEQAWHGEGPTSENQRGGQLLASPGVRGDDDPTDRSLEDSFSFSLFVLPAANQTRAARERGHWLTIAREAPLSTADMPIDRCCDTKSTHLELVTLFIQSRATCAGIIRSLCTYP